MNLVPRPLRRFRFSRVLAGTLLLPMLLGALVLWSLGDRPEQVDKVPAAVVNLDKPVTTKTPEGKEQIVYGGRLLASGLTSPSKPSDSSLGWRLTAEEDAQQGLEDGRYYAVITIPEDFSKRMSSISGQNPQQAGVVLQTNDASSAVVGEASKQVTTIATTRLGHTITSTYLEGVNKGTEKLKSQLGDAADGAGRLADGSDKLANGADQLSGGAGELAGGLDRLAKGADQLAAGNRKLANGTAQLHRGTHRFADGLSALAQRTEGLPGQSQQLAGAANQLSNGASGINQVISGWDRACQDPQVRQANPQLCAATQQAAGQSGQLTSGIEQLADGAAQLANAAPQLNNAIQRGAAGARRLDRGVERLDNGASRLASGADQLATGAGKAADGADQLASGSDQLADGSTKLSDGTDKLATGLEQGSSSIPTPAEDQPKVVADPISSTSDSINPMRDGSTLLLPAVLAFALWLGAFVTYLVRRALPLERLLLASSGARVALAGWLPGVVIGAVQAAMVLGIALLLGAQIASPIGLVAVLLVATAVFAALNQAFVAVSGRRRGWIVAIVFAALQFVSLGGLVPIDTAPWTFQFLNQVLPVSRAADAFAQLTLGGRTGSLAADITVLVLWGLGALAATTLAARRAQKVDLSEVRTRELVGSR